MHKLLLVVPALLVMLLVGVWIATTRIAQAVNARREEAAISAVHEYVTEKLAPHPRVVDRWNDPSRSQVVVCADGGRDYSGTVTYRNSFLRNSVEFVVHVNDIDGQQACSNLRYRRVRQFLDPNIERPWRSEADDANDRSRDEAMIEAAKHPIIYSGSDH